MLYYRTSYKHKTHQKISYHTFDSIAELSTNIKHINKISYYSVI